MLMKYILTLFLFFAFISFAQEPSAEHNTSQTADANLSINPSKEKPKIHSWRDRIEFDYELDAYYSNISWTIALSDEPIENATDKSELNIYYDLLKNSFPIRFFIIELSVNPLPVLGVYLKKNERQYYDKSVIFGDVNLIDAITAGFQEPYALSFFLGNTVKFTEPGQKRAGSNRAYGGWLISLSDQHISQNILVPDYAMELEWKIIGSRSLDDYKLGWSYRIGMKLHQNPEITDTVYLGFRRSRLDFVSDALSFLNNSAFEYTSKFSKDTFEAIGHEFYFEKKFPISLWGKKLGLNFGLGYIYQGPNKYSGSLKQTVERDQIIIRPNIQF